MNEGKHAENHNICVAVKYTNPEAMANTLAKIADQPCPLPDKVLARKQVADTEKWDRVLPEDLFLAGYASRALALEDALKLCKSLQFLPEA